MIGIVAVAIIGIGITAVYAGPMNPLITLAGDVVVDGVLANAAISTDLNTITTELQTMNTKLATVTGIAGPQGQEGPQGPVGPAGGFLTTYVNNGPSTNVPANNFATSTANCDAGDIATGGGSALGTVEKLVSSLPTFTGSTPTGWAVQAFNPTNQASVFIAATVICVDVTP